MRPGLLIEIEDVTVARIASPSSFVMTGLVPVTHAAPRVQTRETKSRYLGPAGRLHLVGVGSRDKPGHDGDGYDGVGINPERQR